MRLFKRGLWLSFAGASVLAVSGLQAQTSDAARVTKYRVFDVGAFSAGASGFFDADYTGDDFTPRALNASGQLAGFFSYSPASAGSFLWSAGGTIALPNLPNAQEGSNATGLNNAGLAVGASSYGLIDQQNGSSYYHAVAWRAGQVHDLGDLGGLDSWANFANDTGLVVGYAYNTTPDPFSYYGTQYHATTWNEEVIRDLGTLGGTDSEGWTANDQGDVIGISFTNNVPIPPFNQPQEDAFVWSQGSMTDLGTIGGVFSTPTAINASGEVAVVSYDATNQYFQSFLWTRGDRTILSSPGGNFNEALTLNDLGVSTGAASDASDANLIAAAWSPSGRVKSLGTVGTDTGSIGFGINRHNVIVGGSGTAPVTTLGTFAHAFVWQNGTLQDLNTLVGTDSTLVLNVAYAINDAGVIAGVGTNSFGNAHAFVLVPESTSAAESFETAASKPVRTETFVTASAPTDRLLKSIHVARSK